MSLMKTLVSAIKRITVTTSRPSLSPRRTLKDSNRCKFLPRSEFLEQRLLLAADFPVDVDVLVAADDLSEPVPVNLIDFAEHSASGNGSAPPLVYDGDFTTADHKGFQSTGGSGNYRLESAHTFAEPVDIDQLVFRLAIQASTQGETDRFREGNANIQLVLADGTSEVVPGSEISLSGGGDGDDFRDTGVLDLSVDYDDVVSVSAVGHVKAFANSGPGTGLSSGNVWLYEVQAFGVAPKLPTIHVHGATAFEGEDLVFTVSLDEPSRLPVEVSLVTVDGSATGGEDYLEVADTISFSPGQTTREFRVPTIADENVESDEDMQLATTDVHGATAITVAATGTIQDADLMSVVVEFTSENGEPLDQVLVGERFFIDVLAQDNRDDADSPGVISAFADVTFDSQLVTAGDVIAAYNSFFLCSLDGAAGTADECGGLDATPESSRDPQLIFSIEAQATAPGTFVVSTDVGEGLFSENQLLGIDGDLRDRTAYGMNSIDILGELELTIDRQEVGENDGVAAAYATISIGEAPLDKPVFVRVGNSDLSEATIAAFVEIPAGETAVQVPIDAIDDNLLDGTQTVTFTASADGFVAATADLAVFDHEYLTIELADAEISEAAGEKATVAKVSRSDVDDLATEVVATLISSDTGEAIVPEQFVIPAGQVSAEFAIDGIDDNLLDGTQTVTFSVSADGFVGATADLDVLDHEYLTIELADAEISEAAGEKATVGKVSRSDVDDLASDVVVALESSDTGEAVVPDQVVIPAGQASVEFPVDAVDDATLDGPQVVVLSATADGFSEAESQLTVLDHEAVSLTIQDTQIRENDGPAATIATVSRSNIDDLSEDVIVKLASSDPTEAAVPDEVVIPAGEVSASFKVAAVDDRILDGPQSVTLVATAGGFVSGEGVLTVLDHEFLVLHAHDNPIREDGGPSATVATVTRSNLDDLSDDLEVALRSGDETEIVLPPTVTIPAGEHSTTFPVAAIDDNISDGAIFVELSAMADGYEHGHDIIEVLDHDPADLLATSFDALTDHVLGGLTTVVFTVENGGVGSAGPFDVQIRHSDDGAIGNNDDLIVSTIAFDGLSAGASESRTIDIQLDVGTLYDRAMADDPGGLGISHQSESADFLGIVVDSSNMIEEFDESNNANLGHQVDMDDVTYFPFDIDRNGVATPTDAGYIINRLENTASVGDFADIDGTGQVTQEDVDAVVTRIGYYINTGVFEDPAAWANLVSPPPAVVGIDSTGGHPAVDGADDDASLSAVAVPLLEATFASAVDGPVAAPVELPQPAFDAAQVGALDTALASNGDSDLVEDDLWSLPDDESEGSEVPHDDIFAEIDGGAFDPFDWMDGVAADVAQQGSSPLMFA